MEKILNLIINFLVNMWSTFDNFQIPFGNSYFSFTNVIAACFIFVMFSKVLSLLFGFWNGLDDIIIKHDNINDIKARRIERKNHDRRVKEFNSLIEKGRINSKQFNEYSDLLSVRNGKIFYKNDRKVK